DRPSLAASRRPPVLEPLRRLINSLGLPGLEPAVVEGAGVLLGDFDVKQVQLRFHEVAKLLPLRLVPLIPHARQLLVLEIFVNPCTRRRLFPGPRGHPSAWPICTCTPRPRSRSGPRAARP